MRFSLFLFNFTDENQRFSLNIKKLYYRNFFGRRPQLAVFYDLCCMIFA